MKRKDGFQCQADNMFIADQIKLAAADWHKLNLVMPAWHVMLRCFFTYFKSNYNRNPTANFQKICDV